MGCLEAQGNRYNANVPNISDDVLPQLHVPGMHPSGNWDRYWETVDVQNKAGEC